MLDILSDPSTTEYIWYNDHGVQNSLQFFITSFEKALNQADLVEMTDAGLNRYVPESTKGLIFTKILPVDNLVGDGKPGWVLEFRIDEYAAVMALSGTPGNYRITSPTNEWTYFAWSDETVDTYDLNANSVPEIVITEEHWGMGSSHFCDEIFSLFEWDGEQFVNLTPNIYSNANTDFGSCLDFSIEDGPKGTKSISAREEMRTGCRLGDSYSDPELGNLIKRERFEWNGTFFELAYEGVEPIDESIAGTNGMNKCTLSWVNEAGASNDQAFELLPVLLNKQNLKTEFTDQYGPAYLDFFRFKLGTWYAMRGWQSQAISLLTQVREHPDHPEFTTASNLADAFLDKYLNVSPYAGCVAANQTLDFEDFTNPHEPGMMNIEKMRELWGFSDPLWSTYKQSFFSGMNGREDPWNVCSLPAAFRESVKKQAFTKSQDLRNWLNRQGIPFTGLVDADVDSNDQTDWLLFAGTGDQQSMQLWLLLNKASHVVPIHIADYDPSLPFEFVNPLTINIAAAWNTFTPSPAAGQLNIYEWADGIIAFKMINSDNRYVVDTLFSDLYLSYDGSILYFSIQTPQLSNIVNGKGEQVYVRLSKGNYNNATWFILGWDDYLKKVSSPVIESDRVLNNSEAILFLNGDYSQAIQMLEEDLKIADDSMKPRLEYMLALAYEKSGNENEAVKAYLKLWQDFPTDPFTYVAQQQLEMRNP